VSLWRTANAAVSQRVVRTVGAPFVTLLKAGSFRVSGNRRSDFRRYPETACGQRRFEKYSCDETVA